MAIEPELPSNMPAHEDASRQASGGSEETSAVATEGARRVEALPTPARTASHGPDPAVGAGLTLFGIFVMGVAGAAEAHYVFNAGTLLAGVGALLFVLFTALSAWKMRRAAAPQNG